VTADQANTTSDQQQQQQQLALVPARPPQQQGAVAGNAPGTAGTTAGQKRVVAIQETVITQTRTGANGQVLQQDRITVREVQQRPGPGSKHRYAAGKARWLDALVNDGCNILLASNTL
jgi:hypothetical protein